ncbi:MAG: DUF4169 family protein [Rhizobiaceae bacterium]|nr:DUF4169 family protein [Rhizobiaceae bacterium]
MGEVVNLRLARKQKARAVREREAEEARILHGRGKAQKQAEASRRDKADAYLDGHRREGGTAGSPLADPPAGTDRSD